MYANKYVYVSSFGRKDHPLVFPADQQFCDPGTHLESTHDPDITPLSRSSTVRRVLPHTLLEGKREKKKDRESRRGSSFVPSNRRVSISDERLVTRIDGDVFLLLFLHRDRLH